MIAFIERLINRGHAYVGDPGNVYFDVASLPDYGSLTRQTLDDFLTTTNLQLTNVTRVTLRCGKQLNLVNRLLPRGRRHGGVGDLAGISNVLLWLVNILGNLLIFTRAVLIYVFRIMKMSRHSHMAPGTVSPSTGCIMLG